MTITQPALLHHRRRHRAGSSAAVNIHIRELSQLFNSLDPSPFWDRDLDREAAEFIEGEFSEKLSAETWNLYVHAHDGTASGMDLQTALENYYGRMASSARRCAACSGGSSAHFRRFSTKDSSSSHGLPCGVRPRCCCMAGCRCAASSSCMSG